MKAVNILMISILAALQDEQRDGGRSSGTNISEVENGNSLDKEEIFEVLSNERRRNVLGYLQHQEKGKVELKELVTEVTALENSVSTEQITSDDRKSVYVGLKQIHLPKMEECNIIDYDANQGTVELTEDAEKARMYLEFVPKNDIPWSYHYLGVTVLMAAITGLAWLGWSLFGNLDGIVLAGIIVLVFGLSSLVHTLYTYRHRVERSYDFEAGG